MIYWSIKLIEKFGKAFWYAPGVMVLGATAVSLFEGMGPTALTVDFLTMMISNFGSEQATAALSKLIGWQVMTTITMGLYFIVSDIVVGVSSFKKQDAIQSSRSFELKQGVAA